MKSHLIHLIVALVVAAVVIVGYGFWYATITAESTNVADLQSQIAAQTENIGHIVSTRTALADIADDETTIRGYFVPSTGVVAFIDHLETQGKKQGTTVNVLSVSTGSTVSTTTKQSMLALSLAITGTFSAIMRTVGVIEYEPYDLTVSSFSLVQDDKNSWHANMNVLVGSINTTTNATTTPIMTTATTATTTATTTSKTP